jgi:hypothetical protein
MLRAEDCLCKTETSKNATYNVVHLIDHSQFYSLVIIIKFTRIFKSWLARLHPATQSLCSDNLIL